MLCSARGGGAPVIYMFLNITRIQYYTHTIFQAVVTCTARGGGGGGTCDLYVFKYNIYIPSFKRR